MTYDVLSSFCQELSDRCEVVLQRRFSAKDDDHLGFMIGIFAPTQADHLAGIGYLVKGDCFAQAGIIARSMLEGFALLYWAKEDLERARRWRAYCLVHDLNFLRKKQAEGVSIDPGLESSLLVRLRSEGQGFLKPNLRKALTDRAIGRPESYRSVWHGDSSGNPVSIGAIVATLDADLRGLYSNLSKLVHWDIRGMAQYVIRTSTGYEVDTLRLDDALQAMALGFQACMQTFLLLATHFDLTDDLAALSTLKGNFLAAMQSAKSPDAE